MGIKVISIEWNGSKGTINEDEAFAAAEAVEEHITVFELFQMTQNTKKLKIAPLAKAYAALCDVAGVPAEPKAIASGLRGALRSSEKGQFWGEVMGVITPLLTILTDGAPDDGEDKESGNVKSSTS